MNITPWIDFITSTKPPSTPSTMLQIEPSGWHWPGRLAASALVALACSLPWPALADCFDDAAQYHSVNPWILRAIAAQESRFNPTANHPVNSNGTKDHAMTGINDVHLPELARYGITVGDLRDGCTSVFVAGWHLRRKVNEFGNTWAAVGAYNSKTPSKRDIYAKKIQRIIDFWIEKGIIAR